MGDINRRNFLFGTVAAAAAGTALVLRGDPQAIELFKPTLAETLAISRVPVPPPNHEPWSLGSVLYTAEGMPVMYVREFEIRTDVDNPIDATAFGELHRTFVEGIRRHTGRVSGALIHYPSIK